MKRRDWLRFLGLSIAAAALPARAQQPIPRVAWLSAGASGSVESYMQAFRDGMRELGYVEGRNVVIDVSLGQFSPERTAQLAAELIEKKPAVIVANGWAIRSVSRLTKTLPIVVGHSGNLVDGGYAASFSRPGGNVTGITFMSLELVGKRIELLKEILPRLARLAVLADPGHAGEHRELAASKAAADQLGIRIDYHPVKNLAELDAALESARASRVQALVVFPDGVTFPRRERIAEFALKHRLPAVSGWDAYADAGLLFTYGPNLRASWGRLAYYVDRILKGANPADLPVELPTRVEMIVNMKTAKALRVSVPQSVLVRADRVIE